MERKVRLKKGMAIVIVFCMVLSLVPGLPGRATEVKAAENSEPSVTAFATKEQLMTEFTLGSKTSSQSKVGYINFGKNESGTVVKWYILGKDSGIEGENTVLFASTPLQKGVRFSTNTEYKTYVLEYGTYEKGYPSFGVVYPNHYGASSIRDTLQGMETNENYFSLAEQQMMNPTTVGVTDAWNERSTYTVQDKLYLADGDYAADNDDYVRLGTDNGLYVYGKNIKNNFWLRSPYLDEADDEDLQYGVLVALSSAGYVVGSEYVNEENAICAINPAFDLNLSSVLFASAAEDAVSTTLCGTIAADAGMELKLDGSTVMADESVYYNGNGVTYTANAGTVVMVQGNYNGTDWYYSKYVTSYEENEKITASKIQDALKAKGIYGTLDLNSCRTWIERTHADGMTYAKMATKLIEVDSVNIDLETPKAGKPLSGELVILQPGVTGTAKWYQYEVGESGELTKTEVPIGTTVAANQLYELQINLTLEEGYRFIDDNINVSVLNQGVSHTMEVIKYSDNMVTVSSDEFIGEYEFQYEAGDYNGVYDGQAHSINLSVNDLDANEATNPTVHYGYYNYNEYVDCGNEKPVFTDVGTYTVKYMITESGYATVAGTQTVTIAPRNITITTSDQSTVYGQSIDQTQYSVSGDGLVTGERITGITLVSTLDSDALVGSTGKISATGVSIGSGENGIIAKDTTANYNITYNNGTHIIIRDASLAPADIEVTKTQLEYNVGDVLNTDDISVTVKYEDGFCELAPYTTYTTNASGIDMSIPGTKVLTVSYTKDGVTTISRDIFITVRGKAEIITQPINQSIKAGETATFRVSASSTTPMNYQWQESRDGVAWAEIAGATKEEYTTPGMYANASGYQYRCVISNTAGDVFSEAAVLTVTPYPAVIESQPGATYDKEIDVSDYFEIYSSYGQAVYSLVGGTGVGVLSGTTLTVTKTGTFEIQLTTTASGIYDAGSARVTITVNEKGAIAYTAEGYAGVYDGQEHTISLNVATPLEATIRYSTDGWNYSSYKPAYEEVGEYSIYYRIVAEGYETVVGCEEVIIEKREIQVKAEDQTIMWSEDLDQDKIAVSGAGLVPDHSISAVLTPSTERITTSGAISVSNVKIVDSDGAVQTANYKITRASGKLTVVHNTTLPPNSIEVTKTRLTYDVGDTLNVDDITVKVTYKDGYSETVKDFTTNVTSLDMSVAGTKTLTVQYKKNNGSVSKKILISVNQPLEIISEPVDVEIDAGSKATFSVEAQGKAPIAYQWMVDKGDGWTKVSGATASIYTTDVMNMDADGYIYKCLVVNANEIKESETAMLIVNPLPVEIGSIDGDAVTDSIVELSEYFDIDKNAGIATYTVVEGEGTGEGTVAGSSLIVTKGGTFVIQVSTAARGNYEEGSATATITVTLEKKLNCSVKDYSGIYDGKAHGITLEVEDFDGASITYSTDVSEEEYSEEKPEFTEVGEYEVYYKVEGDGIKTITGSGKVTIAARSITITATDQTITWDGSLSEDDFDEDGYAITSGELVAGHSIEAIKLTPGMDFTSSSMTISDAVIVDGEEEDVTENYAITYVNGKLVIRQAGQAEPDEPDEPEDPDDPADQTEPEVTEDENWDEEEEWEDDWEDWEEWEDLEVYNGDANYKVNVADDGSVEVTYVSPKKKTLVEVTVPNTVTLSDGTKAKVTAIAPKAFKNNKKLAKVVIGKNIVSIGKQAFSGCKNLKSITIKTKKLKDKKVGSKAFKGTPADTVIKVPKAKLKPYITMLKAKGIGKKAVIKKL